MNALPSETTFSSTLEYQDLTGLPKRCEFGEFMKKQTYKMKKMLELHEKSRPSSDLRVESKTELIMILR